MKPDCPVKDVPKVKKEVGENAKAKEAVMKGEEGASSVMAEASSSVFNPPPVQPSEDLMKEAVQLLKSLRPSVLWMRQLWLYTLAAAARPRRVLFLKEHPRDPQEYKSPSDPVDYPSFYAWPEWEACRSRFELMEIRVDLGVLGHDRKKPTTLGTNISSLAWLDGLVDRRPREQLMEAQASIQDRTSQSRGWAAWPDRFKEEVTKGIILEFDGKLKGVEAEDQAGVAKMSAEQWKTHVLRDHIPFSKECTTCLKGAGKSRPHRKVPHPDATLSLDVCGPFRPGEDYRKKARYFLVGVYAIPVTRTASGDDPLPQSMVEALASEPPDDPLLPEVQAGDSEIKEVDPKRLEEWERLEVESEDVIIKTYTMVETLTSRQGAELKAALARMVARLKYLGVEVRRIHSDGAAEMLGSRRWCEERSIYRTFTKGSDWKANGRAEAEAGVIRRSINTLIQSAGEGEDLWPLMAKHVGERRGRLQLKSLSFATPPLHHGGEG